MVEPCQMEGTVPQLDRTEDLFDLLDRLSVPMYVAERPEGSDRFLFAMINRAHRRHSGLDSMDLRGSSPFDVMPPARAARLEARYNAALKDHEPVRTEKTVVVNGVETVWQTEVHAFPGLNVRDRVLGIGAPMQRAANESAGEAMIREFQFKSVAALLQAASLTRRINVGRRENAHGPASEAYSEASDLCEQLLDDLVELVETCHSVSAVQEASSPSEATVSAQT